MPRTWIVLDALNTTHGLYTDVEVVDLARRYGNLWITSPDAPSWSRASDVDDLGIAPGDASPGQLRRRRLDRSVLESRCPDVDLQALLRPMESLIADAAVTYTEIVALGEWFDVHEWARGVWPVRAVERRLRRILDAGFLDEEERLDLHHMSTQALSERPDPQTALLGATRLPFDAPTPTIRFPDRRFVFAGQSVSAALRGCQDAVAQRGGRVGIDVTRACDYLVIGARTGADWRLSPMAPTIERAVAYREDDATLRIIGEEDWVDAL